MTSLKSVNAKRKLIMKHYENPLFYKHFKEKADISAYSKQCVDQMHIKWKFVNDKLIKVSWYGKGCIIFKASVDIFLELSLNKSKKEILNLAREYEKMINQKAFNEKLVQKLIVFENVKKQLNRLYCANMISQAIIKKLENVF